MFSECLGEGTLIAETEFLGDFGNTQGGVKESVTGGLNAGLGQKILSTHSEGIIEFSV